VADPLAGFDVRDLPGDVRQALGLLGARTADGTAAAGGLWVPPRYNVTGAPEPSEYVATSRFPRRLLGQQRIVLAPNTGMFGGDGWPAPANGTVSISCVFSAAAKLQVSLDGGRTWAPLGAALTAGQMAGPSAVQVAAGDRIDFSASAAVTATFVRVLYVADIAAAGGASPAPAAVLAASTTTVLAANATYTSAAFSTADAAGVTGSIYSDQDGTLEVQQSPDGTHWDVVDTLYYPGGSVGLQYAVPVETPGAAQGRLVYTNGATAQTTFRLYAWTTPQPVERMISVPTVSATTTTITAGGTSQVVFAARPGRRTLLLQNPSTAALQGIATAESLWLNYGAAAVVGPPSIEIVTGALLILDAQVDPQSVNLNAATTGHAFVARES
jgi:hypothetical protein